MRNKLALHRTTLANERTWLAYIRTALAFLIVGATTIHLSEHDLVTAIGFASLCIGIYIAGYGSKIYASRIDKLKNILDEEF